MALPANAMRRREESPNGNLALVDAAGRLKRVPRKGWIRKLGIERPESVADHSYRTALMAMLYSDQRGLDTARVLKMALLHDLPEAIVGDSIPGERTRSQKLRLESVAMKRILATLPQEQRREYQRIWSEFNRGLTGEARLVRQVDKLEMAIQAHEYGRGRHLGGTAEFIQSARETVSDLDLLAMLLRVAEKD